MNNELIKQLKDFKNNHSDSIQALIDSLKPKKAPPFGTSVIVWDTGICDTARCSLGEFDKNGNLLCFEQGQSPLTTNNKSHPWKKWKIHPDANKHLYFFDHDGSDVCPVDEEQEVVILYSHGGMEKTHAININKWRYVKSYAYWHDIPTE